ncbi:MAG TPA: glycosyltransferase [Thermoanaerobaculia bacterium]|nr:glycosyltransferase [Thermoanaerobaculia bacterium]
MCGLDDELEENLLSFVNLRGLSYEVIISIEGRDDPALPIVVAAVRDHPDVFRVVVGNGTKYGVVNRKVDRLISAARVARGKILSISDSNVRVKPDDIRRTIEAFEDPTVGCVSNLFVGSGARNLGAALESLHLSVFVIPGCVLAAAAGVPCVVGKSMAITRRALQAIGGFEAFRRILAEDQAIGLAVKKAGFKVALSPIVVRNVVVHRTIRRALDRQIRWNKIRYAFSPALYASEILLHPFPLACIAAAFGVSPLLALAVALLRIGLSAMLAASIGANVRPWLTPVLDVAMFGAWFVPFFSNRITWRGYTARIVRGTELVPYEAAA